MLKIFLENFSNVKKLMDKPRSLEILKKVFFKVSYVINA